MSLRPPEGFALIEGELSVYIYRMAIGNRDRALVVLVAIDAALKAGAWGFLRDREPASTRVGPIRLAYAENDSGFGYYQTRLLNRSGIAVDDSFVVRTLAVFLLLAGIVLVWRRIRVRPWIKAVAAAAVYLAATTLVLSAECPKGLSLPPYLRGALRALGPLAVALALYAVAAKPYFKAASAIFLAGTIGNCASLLLPPFAVIDFLGIYRPAIRGYVYANAADAYLAAAAAMTALFPAYLLARSAARSARRRASSP
jgi:hypothetical protein